VKADCIRFKPDNSRVLQKYVTIALNANSTRRRILHIVHGIGRPRLNLSEIKSIIIPVPSILEQTVIIEIVERHLTLIENTETMIELSLRKSESLRQSILNIAFEGKLVAQDPADEPAARLLERIKAEKLSIKSKSNNPLELSEYVK
jgi:type I restriction enzyme S subunit